MQDTTEHSGARNRLLIHRRAGEHIRLFQRLYILQGHVFLSIRSATPMMSMITVD